MPLACLVLLFGSLFGIHNNADYVRMNKGDGHGMERQGIDE